MKVLPKEVLFECFTRVCPQTWGLFTRREGYPCAGVPLVLKLWFRSNFTGRAITLSPRSTFY